MKSMMFMMFMKFMKRGVFGGRASSSRRGTPDSEDGGDIV
jgi:hypothetical protein